MKASTGEALAIRQLTAVLFTLVALTWAAIADAHKPSDSYLTIRQPATGTQLEGQWDIALRDLQQAIGVDTNDDGRITWGELKSHQSAVTDYALSRLKISSVANGASSACQSAFRELLFDEHVDGGYAVLRLDVQCPVRPENLSIQYSLLFDIDSNHRGLLDIVAGGKNEASVLSADRRELSIDLGSLTSGNQLSAFVTEGIWHIWQGYDHILFLITLLLPAVLIRRGRQWDARPSLRDSLLDVLKVVTAFTLAHSLTLTLAAEGFVSLPSRLVESAIALTVLLGALNNLFPLVPARRWAVAFGFGLIHGLGFASVLGDLGLTGWNLTIALVGFNLGVETGQLAIVLVLVPLIFWLRNYTLYRRVLMPTGAAVIGCVAMYWLVLRAFGLSLG